MKQYIVTQDETATNYLLQCNTGEKVIDVAVSNDLMELLAIVYEMAEPEHVVQKLGAGLQ